MSTNRKIAFTRQVLLFELERRCIFSDCNERILVSLTKHEALSYSGFECIRCERWNTDKLSSKDAPFWWDEIENRQSPRTN